MIFGVILFFGQSTFNFCDQASWQSRIAAKPEQGAIGFIIAAFLWFGIPVTITLTTSFTYLAMSYQNGTELLSVDDIESGMQNTFEKDMYSKCELKTNLNVNYITVVFLF